MRKLLLCVLTGSILIGNVFADGVDSLQRFMQANKTLSAKFTQTVFGHKRNQTSTGSMEISRPNKFRWVYDNQGNNAGQLIVCDGKTIYIVDNELQQVTQKKLGQTLDKSPAMLLAGSSDIKVNYIVANKPEVNGVDWVSLKPKNSNDNNGFQVVDMGFDNVKHQLVQMNFTDNFGGKSQINFTNVKDSVKFKTNEFDYKAPKGYDTIDG